jgi:hypothetical protein
MVKMLKWLGLFIFLFFFFSVTINSTLHFFNELKGRVSNIEQTAMTFFLSSVLWLAYLGTHVLKTRHRY